ncbi:MAG: alpha/beta hydrolase [Chloroflexi bacterium]|nr:alpha/beta hydrolase [Chloroflexota bacterium]
MPDVFGWLRTQRQRRLWLLPRQLPVSTHDVEYQPGFLARVYRPVGVSARVAALDVHGGNWTSGDRLQQEQLDRALATNGVLVAAIDYHLAPPDSYPSSVEDVLIAARWLRQHATELGATPVAPIGALGSSAGGHLAILCGVRSSELDFVVADAPITNTADYAGVHPYWPTRAMALDGSPLDVLKRGQARALPPLLITHGTCDEAVPFAMSQQFVERYNAAGGSAQLRAFRGLGHAFVLTHPRKRESREMAAAILQFVLNSRGPLMST